MQTDSPLVYIVIVNWNGWRDTLQCLASIRELGYPAYDIVVVDNASTDESVRRIQSTFPAITLLQSSDNLGFAGGNNIGIRHALERGAEYVWLLNNDTIVTTDTLRAMVTTAATDPTIGIVVSKMYYAPPSRKLYFAGSVMDWKRGVTYHTGQDEEDIGQYDTPVDVPIANGASMLVTRAAFTRAGLFDESYFLYFEETDLCMRIRSSGFRIVYAPSARIWHKVSATVGVHGVTFLYYFTRNNVRFVRSHRSLLQFGMTFPYLVKRSLLNLASTNATVRQRRRVWRTAWVDGLLNRGGRKERLF